MRCPRPTEAAATRLTYITGIPRRPVATEYDEAPGAKSGDALLDALARRKP